MSAPLTVDSTAGDPHRVAKHYTHHRAASQCEILIRSICFSDECQKIFELVHFLELMNRLAILVPICHATSGRILSER